MKAGFARVDVTPPLGSLVSGYFHARWAEGILDPIELNAVAFSEGEDKAVLIAADFLLIMENAATEIRNLVAKRLEIPAENVFLHCLHQHTSMRMGYRAHISTKDGMDDEYRSVLYRKFCDVAQMAMADLAETTVWYAQEQASEPLSFVRRYRMKDGTVRTNPGRGNPNVAEPIGEADNTVRLVRLKRKEKGDIAIVNFSTHPDVIGGTKISADYPGFFRNKLEANCPGVKSIFINGAEGQLVGGDRRYPKTFVSGQTTVAKQIGESLADFVLAAYEDAQPIDGDAVRFGQNTYVATTKFDPARIDEVNRILKLHEEGRDNEILPAHMSSELVAEAIKLKRLEAQKLTHVSMVASAITVGNIGFVGFPGEPFCEIGVMVREKSPYSMTFICCQTNGHNSYFPTAESYDQDGYEPRNNQFVKGTGEGFAEKCLELLQRLHEK